MYVYYYLNHSQQSMKIIYYYICFPIFAHILYFDEAKFSIKLVYLTVSVVRQQNEYEIVTETWPIKTT